MALEREVSRELARSSLPAPTGVAFVPPPMLRGKRVAWLKFRNQRTRGGGQRGDDFVTMVVVLSGVISDRLI
jgi:hypothetical protein